MSDAQSMIETADILAHRAAALGKLPSGVVSVLGTVKKHHQANAWTDEHSHMLLEAINDVSAAIKPESIESIQRRKNPFYRYGLLGYSAVMVAFCFIVLFAIIHLSLLFSPLNTVASEVRSISAAGTGDKLNEIQGVLDDLYIAKCSEFQPDIESADNPASDSRSPILISAETKETCQDLNGKFNVLDSALSKIKEDTTHNLDVLTITTNRLKSSDSFVSQFLAVFSFDSSEYLESKTTPVNPTEIVEGKSRHPIQQTLDQLIKRNSTMEPIAQLVGAHILPLLYGMLGAAVYMLRNINSVPVGVINIADNVLECSLRIGLGGIAGLAIGWFNIGAEAGKLTTTPFAIAFVAGFSIDILFSLLERFINVFSGRPAT